MDNNNFPQDPNLNQNNNQQPFTPNEQPQQPFNAQPQQPFGANQQPFGVNSQQPFNAQPQNDNPFAANNGGHNFNTQPNNPFMTPNPYVPGSDPAAHTKGIISTICGLASILLNLIGMIAVCACSCNLASATTRNIFNSNAYQAYSSANQALNTAKIVCAILVFVSLAAAIAGIVMSALGKKTSKDPLLTAGLTLSIIGAALTFIMLIACACTCVCGSATSSYSASYSSLLNSLY